MTRSSASRPRATRRRLRSSRTKASSCRPSSPRRRTSTRATAASCRRSPPAGTSSSSAPVIRAGARRRRCLARRRRPGRRHAGAGARRRAPRRDLGREGPRLGRGASRSSPSTTCTATSRRSTSRPDPLEPPFTCLLASGGHTLRARACTDRTGFEVLGSTLDDAAGEAFDKGARLLGLGYPGGAEIDRLAPDGDPDAFPFPVARVPGLDFSFSGLKTALLYAVRDLADGRARAAARRPRRLLPARDRRGARRDGCAQPRSRPATRRVAVVGGVAANSELRAALPEARVRAARLCTDNAAMIASAARFAPALSSPGYLALDAYASIVGAPSAPSRAMCVLVVGGAAGAADTPVGAEGWQGLLGKPAAAAARRAVGRRAPRAVARRPRSPRPGAPRQRLQMRSWTATARAAQRRAHRGPVVARRAGRPGAVATSAC